MVMYNHVRLVNPPVYFRVLSWFILYYVFCFVLFNHNSFFFFKKQAGLSSGGTFCCFSLVVGLQGKAVE